MNLHQILMNKEKENKKNCKYKYLYENKISIYTNFCKYTIRETLNINKL